jgi:subtilisin family serine protease
MKRFRGASAIVLALVVGLFPLAAAAAGEQEQGQGQGQAPVVQAPEQGIPGQYIVLVKRGADPRSVAGVAGVSPRHVYTAALNGFAAALNQGQLTALQHNPNVDYIEQDAEVHADTTQNNAPWGLDRIDQHPLPLSGTFTYTTTGTAVKAYIIDTGILFAHTEFGGRAVSGYDAVDGGTADDCNGHGTHVAGTVGGTTYGVAKGVSLVAVRVLDCGGSGTWSGVIAGLNWVTNDHAAGQPAVANMSLGGGASPSVDSAVRGMIADGVATAVAAGNGNQGGVGQDACKYSPARVAEAMTIGATDRNDSRTSWSNYGACVDWFAPGLGITSAWYTSSTATNTISGTSMATPHTTGVAALYLQNHTAATAQTVRDELAARTTTGVVKSSKTFNNNLLFTNF